MGGEVKQNSGSFVLWGTFLLAWFEILQINICSECSPKLLSSLMAVVSFRVTAIGLEGSLNALVSMKLL